MIQTRRWAQRFAMVAAVWLSSSPTLAIVKAGSLRPAVRVVDADGKPVDLSAVGARPTLVVYEDKDSANLNAKLKEELSKLARGDRYRSAVALVPVADVRGYDFWPVRGFVKDAIRDESRKLGATIYCDWSGAFGAAFGMRHGTSSVVLIDKLGRVVFAYEGRVPEAETSRLLEILRAEVEGPSR